ncbi:hypothetical protein ACFFX0_24410 [Citricoccus parietis]|uniref:Uncharacterized protein n=1 Tax=Citricoccus parietis TaxID=592307 RepID=A0ABV5G5I0_9MICC
MGSPIKRPVETMAAKWGKSSGVMTVERRSPDERQGSRGRSLDRRGLVPRVHGNRDLAHRRGVPAEDGPVTTSAGAPAVS